MKINFAQLALPLALSLGLTAIDSEADAKSKTNAAQKAPAPKAKTEKSKKDKTKPKTSAAKFHKEATEPTAAPVKTSDCTADQKKLWKPVKAFINMQTGEIVGSSATANTPAFFSSVTKIMPMYLTLRALRDGKIEKDKPIKVSRFRYTSVFGSTNGADEMPGKITAATPDVLLQYLAKRSSNDAPNTLGILLSGSREAFYDLENSTARDIGMDMRLNHFESATGYNEKGVVGKHKQAPLGMAQLIAHAYKEFPNEFRSYGDRQETVYAIGKDGKEKKFTVTSKIPAIQNNTIEGLNFLKSGRTCTGGTAGGGVITIENMPFAFAYAGYPNYRTRDADINKTKIEIRAAIKSGEIKPFVEQLPVQVIETVKTEIAPQEASISSAPAPVDSGIPTSMLLGLFIIPGLAAIGLTGDHFLNKGKLKQGFVKANQPSVNLHEPPNWLPIGGSPLLSRNPY
ncbi:MAG: hypothetical protein DI586_04040 [Micavibrio aeruginosavorus]|uniref:Peptidase S11 D-alanyl-D-alanine carboxypeptidase A N-terminal domain-containing protein n=1 Tax=Micavibrio aeruginosavorus TaxID=349221 RepID=A0A2W5HE18_9BACT|nr:MAG: hypothetical protein DI586_04040 [Micavibrio aeruginosavorus]